VRGPGSEFERTPTGFSLAFGVLKRFSRPLLAPDQELINVHELAGEGRCAR